MLPILSDDSVLSSDLYDLCIFWAWDVDEVFLKKHRFTLFFLFPGFINCFFMYVR